MRYHGVMAAYKGEPQHSQKANETETLHKMCASVDSAKHELDIYTLRRSPDAHELALGAEGTESSDVAKMVLGLPSGIIPRGSQELVSRYLLASQLPETIYLKSNLDTLVENLSEGRLLFPEGSDIRNAIQRAIMFASGTSYALSQISEDMQVEPMVNHALEEPISADGPKRITGDALKQPLHDLSLLLRATAKSMRSTEEKQSKAGIAQIRTACNFVCGN